MGKTKVVNLSRNVHKAAKVAELMGKINEQAVDIQVTHLIKPSILILGKANRRALMDYYRKHSGDKSLLPSARFVLLQAGGFQLKVIEVEGDVCEVYGKERL